MQDEAKGGLCFNKQGAINMKILIFLLSIMILILIMYDKKAGEKNGKTNRRC